MTPQLRLRLCSLHSEKDYTENLQIHKLKKRTEMFLHVYKLAPVYKYSFRIQLQLQYTYTFTVPYIVFCGRSTA